MMPEDVDQKLKRQFMGQRQPIKKKYKDLNHPTNKEIKEIFSSGEETDLINLFGLYANNIKAFKNLF
jgi:hypothetical protein